LRNRDARLVTALDIDLAAVFDVTDLPFPVRERFIPLAYASHMPGSSCLPQDLERASLTFGT
jgi:hypothetical protein